MKRININIKRLTFSLLLLFVIVIFNFVYASSETAYDISQYTIDAKVMKNGNLHVVENICFDFHDTANGIFRDILYCYNYRNQKDTMKPTSSRYQASNISNITVTELNSDGIGKTYYNWISESVAQVGMSNVFSVSKIESDDGYLDRIKIYIPSNSGTKKYLKIEYDIEDVAVLYQNAGEIYWNFVGNRWDCHISDLRVNIAFESSYQGEEIKFYPHGYTNITDITTKDGELSFFVKDLKKQTAIDARVVFPSRYLNDIVLKKIAKPYDTQELVKTENSMDFGKIRYQMSSVFNVAIVFFAVIFLCIIIKKASQISSKGKNKKVEYYRDILNELPLCDYAKIYRGHILNTNLIMATILDLKERNIIEMRAEKKLEKSSDGIEYNYYLTVKEPFYPDLLNGFELLLLNYLFNQEAGIKEKIKFNNTTIELNERLELLSINPLRAQEFFSVWKFYDSQIGEKLYKKNDKKLINLFGKGVIILAVLLIVNLLIISPLSFDVRIGNFSIAQALYVIYVIVGFLFARAKTLKEEYYDTYTKLKGLEKYLKDYSLIKDRYPIEIELWGKYLVFATLFGIGKKVAKEFKEELLQSGFDDEYIYLNYPLIGISYYNQIFSNAAGSFSSAEYSGFGSGGGGRRRRRRWLLLSRELIYFMKFL